MYRLMSSDRFPRALLAACVSVALALGAACGPEVDVAPPVREESFAEGFLVHRDGVTLLCELLAESYPPQCGGSSLRVDGLDLGAVAGLETAESVTWSNEVLRLTGKISGDVLTVSRPPEVLSQAPESRVSDGTETVVEGYLVHRDGVTLLCELLAESYPPQCGGSSVQVDNLTLDDVAGLQSAEGVTWSDDLVRLTGRLAAGVLTVTAVGGGDPVPLPAEPAPVTGDSDATAARRNPDGPAAVGASSSSSSDSTPTSAPPAVQQGSEEPDVVEGLLVHRDGVTLLCELLAESYPPQCGGSSVRVESLDLDSIAGLQTAEGVTWSNEVVRLTGRLAAGVLTVTAVGGGDPVPLPAKPAPVTGDSDATAARRNPDGPAAVGASSSSSSDSTPTSAPPAVQQGSEEPDVVEGLLVHRDGVTLLCELLAESYPPQCGGSSVRVEGLDLDSIAGLQTAEGVTWSNEVVRLTGRLRDGALNVG